MAYKIRVTTRKEQLKKPDEFIGTVDWLGDTIRLHAKNAWMIVGVVLAIGTGIGAMVIYQNQQNDRAAALEYQGFLSYRQQASSDQEASAPSTEDGYRKAIEQFQNVIREFPRTPSAVIAQLYLGNAYMELGEFDSAITAYQEFLDRNSKNDILASTVHQRLGYAYLAKNDFEKARQALESVDPLAGALNRDQIDFELGRIYETMDNKDEAVKRYQEIVSRYPDSLFLSEAQKRLSILGVGEPSPGGDSSPPALPTDQPAANQEK